MIFLAPFGWIYGLVMWARNWLYDRGILKSYALGAGTISVGNITAGGTGKTPLVALIAEILADAGEKVCILTRGYRRLNENERVLVSDGNTVLADADTGGDEPVELAQKLLGKAVVIADADRISAAKWAKDNFEVTTFILDDAFQHRRVKRDVDILCIDATRPFGNERLLPAGSLREAPAALNRADAIVITGDELSMYVGEKIAAHCSKAAIFHAKPVLSRTYFLADGDDSERPNEVFAFCALATPERFTVFLQNNGFDIVGSKVFRDHHRYSQADIEGIEAAARTANAKALFTTHKDAVKLADLSFTIPCYVAEIRMEITDPEEFRDLLGALSAGLSGHPNKTP